MYNRDIANRGGRWQSQQRLWLIKYFDVVLMPHVWVFLSANSSANSAVADSILWNEVHFEYLQSQQTHATSTFAMNLAFISVHFWW